MKDRKTWKSRSKEKVMGVGLAFLFSARKQETFTQTGTIRIDHSDAEENPESVSSKCLSEGGGKGPKECMVE